MAEKMKLNLLRMPLDILMTLLSVILMGALFRGKYMFGLQQFFFFDFERGYVLFALDYVAIIVPFGTVAHYIGKLLVRGRK